MSTDAAASTVQGRRRTLALLILVTALALAGLVIAVTGLAMALAVSLAERGFGADQPEQIAIARALAPFAPGFVVAGLAFEAAAVWIAIKRR